MSNKDKEEKDPCRKGHDLTHDYASVSEDGRTIIQYLICANCEYRTSRVISGGA